MNFIFKPRCIPNPLLFWIVVGVIVLIIILTIVFIVKEVKKNEDK